MATQIEAQWRRKIKLRAPEKTGNGILMTYTHPIWRAHRRVRTTTPKKATTMTANTVRFRRSAIYPLLSLTESAAGIKSRNITYAGCRLQSIARSIAGKSLVPITESFKLAVGLMSVLRFAMMYTGGGASRPGSACFWVLAGPFIRAEIDFAPLG